MTWRAPTSSCKYSRQALMKKTRFGDGVGKVRVGLGMGLWVGGG